MKERIFTHINSSGFKSEQSNSSNDSEDGTKDNLFLSQEEGLRLLGQFLRQETPFGSLQPFVLEFSRSLVEGKSRQMRFYIGPSGSVQSGHNYMNLLITQTQELGPFLYVIPRAEQERGINPYYWLDFYNEEIENLEGKPVTACRLDPEKSKSKIDFRYWHGLEEQLLVDLILGNNGVMPSDLLPFVIRLTGANSYYLDSYRTHGLRINLKGSPLLNGNNELKVVPRTDEQNLYHWIDIFKVLHDTPEDLWPKVSSYRIIPGEQKLISNNWSNPEIQVLIDYLSGVEGVSFENLRPIKVKLRAKSERVQIFGVNKYYINLPPSSVMDRKYQEVVLIPKQDEKGIYQWLEAYALDSATNNPYGECITSVRVVKGEGIVGTMRWLGPGKQHLYDYFKSKILFSQLIPISLVVGKSDMISIWNQKGDSLRLYISRDFGLIKGDIVSLVPEQELDGKLSYLLMRNGNALGRYFLMLGDSKFTLEAPIKINKTIDISLPQVNKESGVYIDESDEQWVTLEFLQETLGVAYATVRSRLNSVHSKRGLDRTGRETVLYKISEVKQLFVDFLSLPRIDSKTGKYRDNSGEDLVAASYFFDEFKVGQNTIKQHLRNNVDSVDGRTARGKTTKLYKESEARKSLQEKFGYVLNLPMVDRNTNKYSDEDGESWATINLLANLTGITKEVLLRLLDNVHSIKGRDRSGHEVILYNETDVLRAIEEKKANSGEISIFPEQARREMWKLLEVEYE